MAIALSVHPPTPDTGGGLDIPPQPPSLFDPTLLSSEWRSVTFRKIRVDSSLGAAFCRGQDDICIRNELHAEASSLHVPWNEEEQGIHYLETRDTRRKVKAKVHLDLEPVVHPKQLDFWSMSAADNAEQRVEVPHIEELFHILRKGRDGKDLVSALHVYKHISYLGLETNFYIGNHTVPMFVECGGVHIAQQVFNKLDHRNEHSWSALLLGYSQIGHLELALHLYNDMQSDNVQPSSHTFLGLLKGCVMHENVDTGRKIHSEINQKGFNKDILVGNALVDMYAKCGLLAEAQMAFEELPIHNVVSWTALISGYADHDHGWESLDHYNRMQLEGIPANSVTIACVLKACGSTGDVEKGQEIHSEAIEKGFEHDLAVSNSLISMYAKCGFLHDAERSFNMIQERDVISWNALIVEYAERGCLQDILECLHNMQLEEITPDAVTFASTIKACGDTGEMGQGQEVHMMLAKIGAEKSISVHNSLIGMYSRCGFLSEAREILDRSNVCDVVSWTALVSGYAELGLSEDALNCFAEMEADGIFPNAVTFTCAMKACGIIRAMNDGQQLHSVTVIRGFDTDSTVGNALIGMYCNFGSLSDAFHVFDRLPVQGVVAWTALIGGYVEHGLYREALELFDEMHQQGVSFNTITLLSILKACGNVGAVERGFVIHALVVLVGYEWDSSICNGLINMYSKLGSLEEAREVFDSMPEHDVVAWSSLIKCYAINHKGDIAIQCFEDMQQQGVKADTVTFTCLLTACSHAGLTVKGMEYFRLMTEKCGITPTKEHYSCIIDLLARSGYMFEAEKMLESFSLTEDAWASLLTACKTHGELELGFRCFQKLILENPSDAAWYSLMADIFADAGRAEDAHMIERLRKHMKANKKRASASIEVNAKVYTFVVGENQSEDVLTMLKTLNSRMKQEGHLPNLDQVLKPVAADHEKDVTLCEHAEKIAIAFGILNTPEGATLRVSKNLRMCDDCHNAGKIISKMERREIILRDDCCIHHFNDGSCACGDMF